MWNLISLLFVILKGLMIDDDEEKAGGDQVSFDEPAVSHIYDGFEIIIGDEQ